jgi:anti-sigma B factor antagonist
VRRVEGSRRRDVFEVETHERGEATIVSLCGELDLSSAGVLRDELDKIEAEETQRELILDLRELDFLDSTGLRMFLDLEARRRAHAHPLAVSGANAAVQRLFTVTGTTTRFRFVTAPKAERDRVRETLPSKTGEDAKPAP